MSVTDPCVSPCVYLVLLRLLQLVFVVPGIVSGVGSIELRYESGLVGMVHEVEVVLDLHIGRPLVLQIFLVEHERVERLLVSSQIQRGSLDVLLDLCQ